MLEQCAAARGFVGNRLLGGTLALILLGNGVEQHIEMTSQATQFIVAQQRVDTGGPIALTDGRHRGTDRAQLLGQLPTGAQKHDGQGQHGQREQPGHHAQQQQHGPLVGGVRERHADHADASAIAIHHGLKAGHVFLVRELELAEPGVSLSDHGLHNVGFGRGTDGARPLLTLSADGNADTVNEEGRDALGITRQRAHREDDLPHMLDQRGVLVQQYAADQNGIRVVDGQGKVCRGIDQQPACFDWGGLRCLFNAGLVGKLRRERTELVRLEPFISGVGDPDLRLTDDVGVGQPAARRHAGAGADHGAVCQCHDQKIQSAAFGGRGQQLVEFPGGRWRAEQMVQTLRFGQLGDPDPCLGLQLIQVIVAAGQIAAQVGQQQTVGMLPADHHRHGNDDRKGHEQGHQAECQ